MPIPFYHPKPASPAAFAEIPLPYKNANPFSRLVFSWIGPIMRVGYSRPLQLDDLWTLTEDLQCKNVADALEANYNLRLPPSLRAGQYKPDPSTSTSTSSQEKSQLTTVESTRSGNSLIKANTYTSTEVDLEKGQDQSQSQDKELVKHEVAALDVVSDMANNIGDNPLRIEGDAEGPIQPREGILPLNTTTATTTATAPLPLKLDIDPDSAKAEKEKEIKKAALVKKYGKKKAGKILKGDVVEEDGKLYDQSLVKAMFRTVWSTFWFSVILKACGACLQITSPLITRKIITQLELANAYHTAQKAGLSTAGLQQPRSVGYGIGLAIALFVMEMAGSLFTYHAANKSAVAGLVLRSSIIDLISRKSMRLSGKSRVEMTNGRLTTMVSADASFLDFAAPMTLELIVQPLQIVVGIGLLIYTLGYSALVGLGTLIIATPLQAIMLRGMITHRMAQMAIVDKRVRLLSEIINNIRAVKLNAYELFFGEKVSKFRRDELSNLRKNGRNRATMTSTMSSIPVIAAVLTFITYGLSGHALNAAIIFSGLQYFNTLKAPIAALPLAFAVTADAAVGMGRIGAMLRSEELKSEIKIDPTLPNALEVKGTFQFDSVLKSDNANARLGGPGSHRLTQKKEKEQAKKDKLEAKERKKKGLPPLEKPKIRNEDIPFAIKDIALKVPRGSLVCIVGRVGTGKTALLSSLINEVRLVSGHVVFGGPVTYVPQQAWVQSGTIRENITFSSKPEDVDIDRVNEVVDACALRPDIDMLADGDLARIGERGITLSGGQRQRICLARAAYDKKSQVVLLDDPLSAVDAHVGHHLLQNCILNGPLAKQTRILVTHHLDVLPRADWVLVMDREGTNGRIVQQGTYAALREEQGVFRTLMEEFGSTSKSSAKEGDEKVKDKPEAEKQAPGGGGGKLLLDEEREIGAVSWRVYKKYGSAINSWSMVLICLALSVLVQGATVVNSLFLGFWTGESLNGFKQGDYMAIYGSLGVAAALFTWGATYLTYISGIRASFSLFDGAWKAVMRSPVGWHDRTPTGRIISRLSKDIEMLDDRLAMVWNQLVTNGLNVVGTFALVIYSFPWLGLVFIPLGLFYYIAASYYRQTSREVKRLDSIARSSIYTSFGESLAGLAVVRAFRQQENFQKRLQDAVNVECQAYIITITIQRWLGVRLDFLSYILVMLIAIFAAVFRNDISASKVGVVLSYSLSAAAVFSQLVQLFAQVEQEMNNVERVQYYNDLQTEANLTLPSDPDKSSWPTKGLIEFQNVQLRYREELPLILKGLTFTINPSEKVGIIGRTGAGKSSLAQALFRTVELCEGKIVVDGKDLKELGLETVRDRIAIIPQDAFLFAGTVRDNVDPTSSHTDQELEAALALVRDQAGTKVQKEKFTLDAQVLNEGSNYSAVSLVRALARRCKILMLDEATSSVDPETDAVIQRIIQTEFSDVTLISIAHRLQTVAYYDRIIVMDNGQIAEFDTPLALYDDPNSAFRSLCDTKRLNRQDLLNIQADAAEAVRRSLLHKPKTEV